MALFFRSNATTVGAQPSPTAAADPQLRGRGLRSTLRRRCDRATVSVGWGGVALPGLRRGSETGSLACFGRGNPVHPRHLSWLCKSAIHLSGTLNGPVLISSHPEWLVLHITSSRPCFGLSLRPSPTPPSPTVAVAAHGRNQVESTPSLAPRIRTELRGP